MKIRDREISVILTVVVLIVSLAVISLPGEATKAQERYSYIIIYDDSVENMKEAIINSGFITWKQELGFKSILLKGVSEIYAQENENEFDKVEQIRSFLRKTSTGQSYVLLIGHPGGYGEWKDRVNEVRTITDGSLPMRIAYPRGMIGLPLVSEALLSEKYGVTDFCYADVFGDWDKNKNGVYGEMKAPRPDETLDDVRTSFVNYVGRIPFGSPTLVEFILRRTVDSEKQEWIKGWKKNILAAFWWSGYDYIGEKIKKEVAKKQGSSSFTLYEKEGLGTSQFLATASLNKENFLIYWNLSEVVVSSGHGGVAREVWVEDRNKNGVPDQDELIFPYFLPWDSIPQLKPIRVWYNFGCTTFDLDNLLFSKELSHKGFGYNFATQLLALGLVNVAVSINKVVLSYMEESPSFVSRLLNGEMLAQAFHNAIEEEKFRTYATLSLDYVFLGDPSFKMGNVPPAFTNLPASRTIPVGSPFSFQVKASDPEGDTLTYSLNNPPLGMTITTTGLISWSSSVKGSYIITLGVSDGINPVVNSTLTLVANASPFFTNLPASRTIPAGQSFSFQVETSDSEGDVLFYTLRDAPAGMTVTAYGLVRWPDPARGNYTITVEVRDWVNQVVFSTLSLKVFTTLIFSIGKTDYLVDGVRQTMDVAPVLIEGRTLLPIRFVIEPLGASISWENATKKVTITLGLTTIELWINNSMAKVNGRDTPIDPINPKVVPIIKDGRTLLPLRFISEILGAEVSWDGVLKIITVRYPK